MIRPKLFNINLDLKNRNYITDIIVSQGDQLSNVFRFNLVQDSLPYDLTGLSVKVYFERPDKFTSFITGQLVDAVKGVVDVELTNQILNTPGVCACQVIIVGTENEILSSLKILFTIEKSVNYSAVESTNEYNALVDALSNVQSIRNEFDIVIANATVDSEVILARGANTTLKKRLDNVDAQLADIEQNQGLLSGLLTTAKTSLVNAINELFNTKANKTQEAWISPTLINGATGTVQYRKNQFGRVEFRGTITIPTVGVDGFILPAGYIPVDTQNYLLMVGDASTQAHLRIYSNGAVRGYNTSKYNLNALSWVV